MRYRNVAVGLLVVLVLAAGVGAYFYFFPTTPSAPATTALFGDMAVTPVVSEASPQAPREHPDGWVEYRNSRYSFSLFHPPQQKVQEFDEGAGAMTITFEDTATVRGFQIFVVPYGENQVSEDRFRKDAPSGVRAELVNITVDGATGASFYSINALLGDTREVWFVKNGYLFELTTLKPLETMLDQVLQTLRFVE